MLSRFLLSLIINEVSLAVRVKCERNLYPFGDIGSSRDFSSISLDIASISSSPSNVKFASMVLALLRGIFA